MMTINQLTQDVEEFCKKAVFDADPEALHGEEDDFYTNVLQAIADRKCEDPQQCASIVLKISSVDFTRWYA